MKSWMGVTVLKLQLQAPVGTATNNIMVCREHNDNVFPEHLLTHVLRSCHVWPCLMFTTVYEVCFHFIHEKSLSERSSLTWNCWSKDLNWCWSGCYFLIVRPADIKYFRFYWCTSIALNITEWSYNSPFTFLSVILMVIPSGAFNKYTCSSSNQ